jgi:hypothetical protein
MMFKQIVRRGLSAALLLAALFLVVPTPAQAKPRAAAVTSPQSLFDQAWRWLARTWGEPQAPGSGTKTFDGQGGYIDPNGAPIGGGGTTPISTCSTATCTPPRG